MAERYTRRRFGDRRDGRKLRAIAATQRMLPFIQPRRSDATNYLADSVEITAAEDWLRSRSENGMPEMSLVELFVAAYVRALTHCPSVNRFCIGRRIYARSEIEVVLTDLGVGDSGLKAVKVRLDDTDTISDVYRKIKDQLDQARAEASSDYNESTADFLLTLPRFLLRFMISVLRWMDFHSLLPYPVLQASPYHASLQLSSSGHPALAPMQRHLPDFGTLSMSLCLGHRRTAVEVDENGRIHERRYQDFTVAMDERVTESNHFANAILYLKYYLSHPAELEKAPTKVLDDSM